MPPPGVGIMHSEEDPGLWQGLSNAGVRPVGTRSGGLVGGPKQPLLSPSRAISRGLCGRGGGTSRSFLKLKCLEKPKAVKAAFPSRGSVVLRALPQGEYSASRPPARWEVSEPTFCLGKSDQTSIQKSYIYKDKSSVHLRIKQRVSTTKR